MSQSLKQAFIHYERASDLGHAKACTKLGHLYYSGIPSADIRLGQQTVSYWLEPNKETAFNKYSRAGKRGDSEAYNCAGLIMEQLNPVEAVDLYRKAIALDANNTDAMFNMALLYYNSKDESEWHEEAV